VELITRIDHEMRATLIEIAEPAVKLCQLSGCQNASDSDETFKAKFGFAFDLLVVNIRTALELQHSGSGQALVFL
jgi:hypothetical protein